MCCWRSELCPAVVLDLWTDCDLNKHITFIEQRVYSSFLWSSDSLWHRVCRNEAWHLFLIQLCRGGIKTLSPMLGPESFITYYFFMWCCKSKPNPVQHETDRAFCSIPSFQSLSSLYPFNGWIYCTSECNFPLVVIRTEGSFFMSQGERTTPLGAIHFVAFTEPCQACFLNHMKINYKPTCLRCHLSM